MTSHSSGTPRRRAHRAITTSIALLVGMAGVSSVQAKPARHARHAERDGIALLSLQDIAALGGKVKKGKSTAQVTATATTATTAPVTVDPRRSLMITDTTIVTSFPILDVLNRLAAGSPNSMIARQLYDQWMDLHNAAPGIGQGGHCNDELTNGVATLNGFQFDCPRAEGKLVGTNPTNGTPDSFRPIAVVNRFDLASDPRTGGTDCGEYRLIYAKNSGMSTPTNRMLIIFEGVLPNPAPNGKDLTGCRPVAQFWADLSNEPSLSVRASKLRSFFFDGLPGFEPVVKASHYGFATPTATGQIRTNLFMQFNWVLREYRLALVNNSLKMLAQPIAGSPAAQLFNETDPHPKGPDFRNSFLGVVPSLAINNINTFNDNGLPGTFNSGDGDQQSSTKGNYPGQFAQSPNFSAAIQQKLTAAGSTLTPAQVVDRSMAMSCAGCHQLSNNRNLGGGIVWPASLGFVHVTEAAVETSPEGVLRFKISPALTNVFLPRRKAVLEAFLNGV